jgi:NUMOD3 motif
MQPYTYLIRWPKLNISYYGVRYAQDCNPSDLWNPYKTSSHHVKEFIKEHGEPTVVQVRKVFANAVLAQEWEHRVLKRMKVVGNGQWLNKNDRMAPPINPFGNLKMKEPELRKKASDNNKGSGNPMFGKKQEQKTCPHCNKTTGANTYARWHGENCPIANPTAFRPTGKNNPFFGKQHLNIEVGCCSCYTVCDIRNFYRHHGIKCKKQFNQFSSKHEQMSV